VNQGRRRGQRISGMVQGAGQNERKCRTGEKAGNPRRTGEKVGDQIEGRRFETGQGIGQQTAQNKWQGGRQSMGSEAVLRQGMRSEAGSDRKQKLGERKE
jgi:hypothetical protein